MNKQLLITSDDQPSDRTPWWLIRKYGCSFMVACVCKGFYCCRGKCPDNTVCASRCADSLVTCFFLDACRTSGLSSSIHNLLQYLQQKVLHNWSFIEERKSVSRMHWKSLTSPFEAIIRCSSVGRTSAICINTLWLHWVATLYTITHFAVILFVLSHWLWCCRPAVVTIIGRQHEGLWGIMKEKWNNEIIFYIEAIGFFIERATRALTQGENGKRGSLSFYVLCSR